VISNRDPEAGTCASKPAVGESREKFLTAAKHQGEDQKDPRKKKTKRRGTGGKLLKRGCWGRGKDVAPGGGMKLSRERQEV